MYGRGLLAEVSQYMNTAVPEMIAQLLKRAGKRMWHPERVVRVMGSGGEACGVVAGVASAARLKVVVVPWPVLFSI
jgi:hypothetical protein